MKKLDIETIVKHLQEIGENERMIKYYIETYYFYQLSDGLILEFRKKPSIDKTLYFDDELPIPKLTEELFLHYNEKNVSGEYFELPKNDSVKAYLIQATYNDNLKASVQRFNYLSDYESNLKWAHDKGYFKRFMTNEEIEEYNSICKELKAEYIERLKKYFKRYNKNIYCMGYWVNR